MRDVDRRLLSELAKLEAANREASNKIRVLTSLKDQLEYRLQQRHQSPTHGAYYGNGTCSNDSRPSRAFAICHGANARHGSVSGEQALRVAPGRIKRVILSRRRRSGESRQGSPGARHDVDAERHAQGGEEDVHFSPVWTQVRLGKLITLLTLLYNF